MLLTHRRLPPPLPITMDAPWWNLWAEEPASPQVAATISGLCWPGGWTVRCSVGSEVARELGGTGTLSKEEATGTLGLDFAVAFSVDEGFEPPQGSVRLLTPSRFLSTDGRLPGFWSVDATDDDDVPTAIRWRLACTGITSGDNVVIPEGPLYFNALVEERRRSPDDAPEARPVSLGSGRLTVKEDIGVNTLFQSRGILAEFKLVGPNPNPALTLTPSLSPSPNPKPSPSPSPSPNPRPKHELGGPLRRGASRTVRRGLCWPC